MDDLIATVEQQGRRYVAYLVDQPRVRSTGASAEEALAALEEALRLQLYKQRKQMPPRVEEVVLRSRRR